MSDLTFSDGMKFDISGKLRVVRRRDGYYVVGEGTLCAVETIDEGKELIKKLTTDNKEPKV